MQTNKCIKLFCSLSVLLAGLASCSSDKKSETKADEWPRPKVMIVKNGAAATFSEAEKSLATTDSVRFEFAETKMSDSIRKIDVVSHCISDSQKEELSNMYSVSGVSEFRIIDVLSDELLFLQDRDVTCGLTATITNEYGSTKSFELSRLRLKRENEDKLTLVLGNSTVQLPEPVVPTMQKNIRIENINQKGGLKIFCDSFQAGLETENLSLVRLSDFSLKPHVPTAKAPKDSRTETPRQTCRVIYRISDTARTVALSAPIKFDFGYYPIELKVRTVNYNPDYLFSSVTPLQVYSITNLNDAAISVGFPRDGTLFSSSVVRYTVDNEVHMGTQVGPFRFPLTFEISGGNVSTSETLKIATIQPRQSVQVALTVPTKKCGKYQKENIPPVQGKVSGVLVTIENPEQIKLVVASQSIEESVTKTFVPHYEEKLWTREPAQLPYLWQEWDKANPLKNLYWYQVSDVKCL
jgi:hypothetical protein